MALSLARHKGHCPFEQPRWAITAGSLEKVQRIDAHDCAEPGGDALMLRHAVWMTQAFMSCRQCEASMKRKCKIAVFDDDVRSTRLLGNT